MNCDIGDNVELHSPMSELGDRLGVSIRQTLGDGVLSGDLPIHNELLLIHSATWVLRSELREVL